MDSIDNTGALVLVSSVPDPVMAAQCVDTISIIYMILLITNIGCNIHYPIFRFWGNQNTITERSTRKV